MSDFPSREILHGKTVTENLPQYNTENVKTKNKTDYEKSINLSIEEKNQMNREMEVQNYREIIADNIKLYWLLEVAESKG